MLTPSELIEFYANLRGIQNVKQIIKHTLSQFDLSAYEKVPVRSLSGGNKRKLNTAISVLGQSQVILMDEPTSGMDPSTRSLLLKTIRQLTREGRSVLVTSHCMADCETICDRVGIMLKGELIALGSPNELKQRFFSGYVISIQMKNFEQCNELEKTIQEKFASIHKIGQHYRTFQYLVPPVHRVSELFEKMAEMSKTISMDYTLSMPSLDNVFVNLCQDSEDPTSNKYSNEMPLQNLAFEMDTHTIADNDITHF